jgi:hypothetical protein
MAVEYYRSAELIFGWSFYRQGTTGDTSSADEFLDAALHWFGDTNPRLGTAWEKGERVAKIIAHRRTLLVLDGLEPLQNPPGPQEGRLREPSLQALLRQLAAFNMGLCVITTRLPIADIADCECTSAPCRELEQLSSDAGAKLLRALGVKGPEAELRNASDEFRGHCLALTLLSSYLTDAYDGDIRSRKEVSMLEKSCNPTKPGLVKVLSASFSAAIRTAREQKSISREKRAEATYAEHLRQKTGWVRKPRIPTSSLVTPVARLTDNLDTISGRVRVLFSRLVHCEVYLRSRLNYVRARLSGHSKGIEVAARINRAIHPAGLKGRYAKLSHGR